jgi:hypothetical protein
VPWGSVEKLGLWAALEPRLARADSVRAALTYVEKGETPLGIVYETDAKVSSKVKIVGVFPAGSHKPVVYPFAILKGQDNAASRGFYDYMTGEAGLAVFTKYGFSKIEVSSVLSGAEIEALSLSLRFRWWHWSQLCRWPSLPAVAGARVFRKGLVNGGADAAGATPVIMGYCCSSRSAPRHRWARGSGTSSASASCLAGRARCWRRPSSLFPSRCAPSA